MFGIEHFALFVVSGLLLNITPGQDTFYIVGRSVTQGRRAGVFAVAGIVSGCIVHTAQDRLGAWGLGLGAHESIVPSPVARSR